MESCSAARISSAIYQYIIFSRLNKIRIYHENGMRLAIVMLADGILVPKHRLGLLQRPRAGLRLGQGRCWIIFETIKTNNVEGRCAGGIDGTGMPSHQVRMEDEVCERVSLSCMVNLILCQRYSESR